MLNIVIPMAGRGSRFADAGYVMPKPLIDIYEHFMIEYVIENVKPTETCKFYFLCLQEHLYKYNLERTLKEIVPDCEVIPVIQVTEGAACTVLLAEKFINNEEPLMIANSDQFVEVDIDSYLAKMNDFDGLIMTMTATDPKWSFIQYDDNGLVTQLREKEAISNEATVGIYNFKKGSDFVEFANLMIKKNIRVNGEFYVAPVYNELIEAGKKITFYNVGSDETCMHGLGIPEDLKRFMRNPISLKVFSSEER